MSEFAQLALLAVAFVWANCVASAGLWAILRRARLGRHALRVQGELPAVLLVRPCAGDEPALEECLSSILRAHHSFRIVHLFATDSADDGAVPAIERVCARLRAAGHDAERIVVPPTRANRKTSLVAGMIAHRAGGEHAAIVNCDSNMDLSGMDLDLLVAPLVGDPPASASWAPHAEREAGGLGSRASVAVMGGSLTSFGLLCGMKPDSLVGKLFAVDLRALTGVGGFEALGGYLAEDLQLSKTLRLAGHAVVAVPSLAVSVRPPEGLGGTIARVSRWMTAVKAQQPALFLTYPLFFFGMTMIAALAVPALASFPRLASATISLAIIGRVIVAVGARHYSARGWRPGGVLVDIVLGDLVLALAWLRAALARRVVWRGHVLRLGPGGRIEGS